MANAMDEQMHGPRMREVIRELDQGADEQQETWNKVQSDSGLTRWATSIRISAVKAVVDAALGHLQRLADLASDAPQPSTSPDGGSPPVASASGASPKDIVSRATWLLNQCEALPGQRDNWHGNTMGGLRDLIGWAAAAREASAKKASLWQALGASQGLQPSLSLIHI